MKANIDRVVRLPDAPPIAGLHFRTFDPDRDYEGLVALMREAHLADGIDWIPTVENLRAGAPGEVACTPAEATASEKLTWTWIT